MRLRCGTGPAVRAGSNVVYVDGGRGQGQGNNVRNVQVITDFRNFDFSTSDPI